MLFLNSKARFQPLRTKKTFFHVVRATKNSVYRRPLAIGGVSLQPCTDMDVWRERLFPRLFVAICPLSLQLRRRQGEYLYMGCASGDPFFDPKRWNRFWRFKEQRPLKLTCKTLLIVYEVKMVRMVLLSPPPLSCWTIPLTFKAWFFAMDCSMREIMKNQYLSSSVKI